MTETYLELTQQIEALKQKAESIRAAEIAGVVERIRAAIEAYGLTPEQLFDARSATRSTATRRTAGRPATRGSRVGGARFHDGNGNSWSGRGPRPGWIKAALAEGKSLDDFKVEAGGAAPKPASTPKYRDDAGHSWSGRGPRPGWVKAALAAGKTLEQLT